MELNITINEYKNSMKEVQLSGSLDSNSYQQLDNEIKNLLESAIHIIVLNMKDLEYISSAGIRVIVKTQKALKLKNGGLYFMNLKPQVKKVFEIINVLPFMQIIDNLDEIDLP
ncbi:MAG: STAS domain-containing protein [Candidatus Marinimicrobia bacterium]|jgi:anti-anti-sigma factor|nr:STAS domain-containing protein [Candidatus Neomarinimicrobiota bacterium]MBT3633544.1 STAS domain-containing protein [Candidatus Neomarinimicrobiota bacterium]MBT3681686.1 STAS domain-containing protein [Candidatus Neomarinimicrobiota bacterium]MBT3758346.1 STAS domain-containing protein [Candidatus Neomarinimicrobiota bacterium]MBT3895000.1 STAS domain-containing protein [Candidatus Neomarinimicrobiota bacterium]